MNIEQKMEWLRPERIQKLYDGQKSPFGMNRLFVIGIGKNGVDCVLRCMHLTEKRFGKDPKKVRFLCIGEETQLGERSYEGSAPGDGFTLPIDRADMVRQRSEELLSCRADLWADKAPVRPNCTVSLPEADHEAHRRGYGGFQRQRPFP